MKARNNTTVTEFIFRGLTDDPRLQVLLFVLILLMYIFTVVWNIGIFALIFFVSRLHTPMYFFLSNLSLSEFCYSSVIAPKMLRDLLSVKKSITYSGWAAQAFLFLLFAALESYILSAMAYDRYAAICHPLLYHNIINRATCLKLMTAVYISAIVSAAAPAVSTFHASFCGPNVIDHFHCDIHPLMKLSCTDTFVIETVTFAEAIFFGFGSLLITATSYIYILSTVLQIPSAAGKLKAFSTCGSHLTSLSLFYGTGFFMFLRFPGSGSTLQNKVVSVFYTIVIPLLNPMIYSLRNQEVKAAMRTKLLRKI